MMTKITPILTILLSIAVAYLLVDKFSTNGSAEAPLDLATEITRDENEINSNEGHIAYIDIDSLNANYALLDDNYKKLDKFRTDIERGIKRRLDKAQQKAQSYQESVSTEEQYMLAQQDLQNDQVNLQQYQEERAQQLNEMEMDLQGDLYERIESFLKDYNKANGYDYVVGYQKGGQVLYTKKDLEITLDVINGLNALYEEEIAQKEAEKKE